MDPLTLLILGGTALSGFLGGGKNTSTTSSTTTLTPELQAMFDQIIGKLGATYGKPFPTDATATPYLGAAADTVGKIGPAISDMQSKYSGALNSIINRSPVHVQIPTMVNGGPSATLSGGSFGSGFRTNPGASGSGGGGGGSPFANLTDDQLQQIARGILPNYGIDKKVARFEAPGIDSGPHSFQVQNSTRGVF